MNGMPLMPRLLTLLICMLGAAAVHAQQPPLTGQMLGGVPSAAQDSPALRSGALPAVETPAATRLDPAVPPQVPGATTAGAVRTTSAHDQVGQTTRSLLRLQASGQHAGPRLPILGDQATLSYARYLKSFEHDIPDFFETDVGKSKGSSSTGR